MARAVLCLDNKKFVNASADVDEQDGKTCFSQRQKRREKGRSRANDFVGKSRGISSTAARFESSYFDYNCSKDSAEPSEHLPKSRQVTAA